MNDHRWLALLCPFCAAGQQPERRTDLVHGYPSPQWVHPVAPCGAYRLHEARWRRC